MQEQHSALHGDERGRKSEYSVLRQFWSVVPMPALSLPEGLILPWQFPPVQAGKRQWKSSQDTGSWNRGITNSLNPQQMRWLFFVLSGWILRQRPPVKYLLSNATKILQFIIKAATDPKRRKLMVLSYQRAKLIPRLEWRMTIRHRGFPRIDLLPTYSPIHQS